MSFLKNFTTYQYNFFIDSLRKAGYHVISLLLIGSELMATTTTTNAPTAVKKSSKKTIKKKTSAKKNLVIVESPAKAKTIEKYLGRNYKVVASVGHIRDLKKSSMSINFENNYEPQYINIRGKGPLINDLKKEAKKSKKVYLASDPDREGEAISWHLAHILDLDENDKTVLFSMKSPKTLSKMLLLNHAKSIWI